MTPSFFWHTRGARCALVAAGAAARLLAAEPLPAEEPAASQSERSLGRILFNDDGDFTFVGETPADWRKNLRAMLAPLKDVPVQTLVYALGTGTDVLLYPSKAGSPWGWRSQDMPEKLAHMKSFPVAVQSGHDGVRWAAEGARDLGLTFVPAFRMNDAHYAAGTAPYLEGKFWAKNREKFTFQKPPYPEESLKSYKELLDFSHPEVRAHRLGVIREAIFRYQDTMDGFLLDFMRTPIFFPLSDVPAKSPLMTELVADVRKALDDAGKAAGHKIPLLVRVPATIRNCETIGLEIRTWIERGLVQVVIPSQAMTLTHDTPVEEFLQLAKPHGVKVYLSLYQRTNPTYAFRSEAPQSADYTGRGASEALIRGAALNALSQGVDGFELYNFNLPLKPAEVAAFRSLLAEHQDPAGKSRTYAATPAYFFDNLDTYEPPKQVPFTLTSESRHKTITLCFGEDPQKLSDPEHPVYVGLRLGFSDAEPPAGLSVSVNGKPISDDDAAITRSQPKASKGPKSYLQFSLPNPGDILKSGRNEITVALPESSPPSTKATIAEIQAGVVPMRDTQR